MSQLADEQYAIALSCLLDRWGAMDDDEADQIFEEDPELAESIEDLYVARRGTSAHPYTKKGNLW